MSNIHFPIFKTKIEGDSKVFDLTDSAERKAYFEHKAGKEIEQLRSYLKKGTFIIYLLGKKGSGKGTYAKMFKEIVDPARIEHFSVGDMIRSFDETLRDVEKRQTLIDFLHEKYRGPISVDEIIKTMESRSTKVLLPTELILALTEREITKREKKAILIDGFPRDFDQVSYSLFFKHLIDYRQDPDIFVLIDVPTQVIDLRVKYRVVCPLCNTSRSVKLLPTKNVEYDGKSFYLLCDNPECESLKLGKGARMTAKEGDEHGIGPIRDRLEKDEKLMAQVNEVHGIKKILLRNSVPVHESSKNYDTYEITPEYYYEFDSDGKTIHTRQKAWEVSDDQGVISNSLMPAPVVVAFIKGLVKVLGLDSFS